MGDSAEHSDVSGSMVEGAAVSAATAPLRQLAGKAAFITGGASGIGLGIADACVAAGMSVVLADLRRDHIDAALERFGGSDAVHAIELDVCDRVAFARAVEQSQRLLGNVHLLVNNAGIAIGGPITEVGYDDWDWGLGVLLGGVINGIQSFLPHMLAHGEGGQIVNTASTSGLLPVSRMVIYNTAKAALIAIAESIREELGERNIGVSAFCPGPVGTNIRESGRSRPERYRHDSGLLQAEREREGRPNSPLWMTPAECGERLLRGVRENDLYILTHPEFKDGLAERYRAILASFPDEEIDTERAAEVPFLLRNAVFAEVLERRASAGDL
ncbi:MAG TPA: SDR family NAD(P)-dependent oxidoreductase [Solirubrobacteraceae bacterium]|jgi:NAD(P)-dependent dehydrogenase (short-subunit alcohol dehydrogenase family)